MMAKSTGAATNLAAVDPDAHGELQLLKEQFDTASANYETLRDSSERTVVRWLWAASRRYHLDPLYFLDPQEDAGQVTRSEPKDLRGSACYGFSGDNRIAVERLYVSSSRDIFYKTFYLSIRDRIRSYHFHYEATPQCINCAQLKFSGRLPAHYLRWAIRGWASHRYTVLDGKIRSVSAVFKQDDEPEARYAGELSYRDDGRIELWTKWEGSRHSKLAFRGMPPAENPFVDS